MSRKQKRNRIAGAGAAILGALALGLAFSALPSRADGQAAANPPGPAANATDVAAECDGNFLSANQLMHGLKDAPPDYPNAIEFYNSVLKECPDFDKADQVAQNLAYAYMHTAPPAVDKAISVLENAVQKFPASLHIVDLQVELGTAYIAWADSLVRGNADQAKPFYQKSVDILQKAVDKITDPAAKAQVVFDVGNGLFEVGDFATAIKNYQALLALKPGGVLEAPALYNMANAELKVASAAPDAGAKADAYDKALAAFRQLSDTYKDDSNAEDARLQMGRILYQQQKYDQAILRFKELVDSKKADVQAQALNYLAFCYVQSTPPDYVHALPLFRKLVQDNPGTTQADNANVEIGYISRTVNKDLGAALLAYKIASTSADAKIAHQALDGELAVAADYSKAQQYDKAASIYEGIIGSTDPQIDQSARYGRVIALLAQKDPQAGKALADYLDKFPDAAESPSAWYQLGVIQYNNKDYNAAAISFGKAARDNNKKLDLKRQAFYWAGQAAIQSGQGPDAAKDWLQGLQTDPDFASDVTAETLLALGQYYTDQGQDEKGSDYIRQAMLHYGDKPAVLDALLAIGKQSIRAKHYAQAIEFYTHLANAQPTTESGGAARFNLGVVYLKMTPPNPDKAAESFQKYLELLPNGRYADSAGVNLGQSMEALSQAHPDQSNEYLTKALAAYKGAVAATKDVNLASQAAWKVGVVEGKLNMVDDAVKDLDAAIAKYPGTTDIDNMAFEKAHILQLAKRFGPAQAAFDAYLKQFPNGVNVPAAHFNMAVMEYNQAELKTATPKQAQDAYLKSADDFEASLAGKAPAVPIEVALYYAGWACLNTEQPTRAQQDFRKLLESYPNSQHAVEVAGRIGILEALTSPDEAIQYLKPYLATNLQDEDLADANLALGQAYMQKNNYDAALDPLRKAAVKEEALRFIDPAASANYFLGRCYAALGNKEQARTTLKKVTLQYKDSHPWADKAAEELQKLTGG